MAKRRSGGGGGSNMGLIVTLVFFILTTITLGVTTYMGYAEVKDYDDKRKAAEGKMKEMEKEKDWYKFQTMVVREYVGHPFKDEKAGDDARTLLAKDADEFLKSGNVARKFGDKPSGLAEFKGAFETMNAGLRDATDKAKPWTPATELSPSVTYVTMLQAEKNAVKQARNDADAADRKRLEAEANVVREQEKLAVVEKNFIDETKKTKDKAATDLVNVQKGLNDRAKEANDQNAAKGVAQADAAAAKANVAALTTQVQATKRSLEEERKVKNDLLAKKSDLEAQLAEVSRRIRDEDKTLADKALDSEALKELGNWHKDAAKMRWQIIRLDQKGTMPYINLGSADGLETQMTFSVHSLGRDGKLSPTPKGTVEVIQLVPNEPHLARVRVTSVTDAKNNPIVAKDQLFNPTWAPGVSKRVAIAGIADLGGEGTEDSDDLRRLLKRQNVIVDAYVATKNQKSPELLNAAGGKGDVTSKTNYVIIADGLDAISNHPKKNDKEYVKAVNDQIAALRTKATANGVTVISLSRYLDMIGYKPARTTRER